MKKLSTDIVVIGTGAAGTAAALAAAENGAKVLVCEKQPGVGSISNFPIAVFAVESSLQRQYGIPLTKDGIFRIIMERTHWKADARLVKAFIDKSASTIEWLQQRGAQFYMWPHFQFKETVLTGHIIKNKGMLKEVLKLLRTKAESLGVDTIFSTPVRELVKEGDKIKGVVAEDSTGQNLRVDAKAVIIASGGFSSNQEMVKKYIGFETNVLGFNSIFKMDGDGIQMAWDAGAASDGMAYQLIFGLTPPPEENRFITWGKFAGMNLNIVMNEPYIYPWINQDGVRFLDEGITLDPHYPANALARQKNKCAYIVFDTNTKEYIEKETYINAPPIVPPMIKESDIDKTIKKFQEAEDKNSFIADTLEELAQRMNINPNVFKNTIDEYNVFCEKGQDLLFGKNPKYLRPVKSPKFYALKVEIKATGTIGGIKINEKAEVINTQGDVIPGLYAAGDCANGITSYDFWIAHALAGGPSSFALNTGRIAAENAVKYCLKK